MARQRQLLKAAQSPNDFFVELVTTKGKFASIHASAFEFAIVSAVLQAEPGMMFYLGPISSGELVLRIGREFRFFGIFRASARMLDRRLTVVAEIIEPLKASARDYLEAPPRRRRKSRPVRRPGFAKRPNETKQPKGKK